MILLLLIALVALLLGVALYNKSKQRIFYVTIEMPAEAAQRLARMYIPGWKILQIYALSKIDFYGDK